MIVYFLDTDEDFSLAKAKELGCELISMPYAIEGKNIEPYYDFETFDVKKYYDTLRAGTIPTTSALSKEKYIEIFEPHFAKGDDIFYIHFSRAMSASFANMDQALEELKAKYPERKFYEVDTMGITTISYAIALSILSKRNEMSPEELVEFGKKEAFNYAMYFFADDLKFFARSGRVKGMAAVMGTLIGVRPIIHMSKEGTMVNIGKEVGRAKAINRLLAYMEELGDDVANYPIYIGHCDCMPIVEQLVKMIKQKYGENINIEIVPVNPTAGAHCGPNGLGVCFHAKDRS